MRNKLLIEQGSVNQVESHFITRIKLLKQGFICFISINAMASKKVVFSEF